MTDANDKSILAAAVRKLSAGTDLSRDEANRLFTELIAGRASEATFEQILVGLRDKGETPEEIAGAAEAMRDAATPFPRPSYAFADTCGTGGDGIGTVNVSTAVAFVAAAAGVPVAKHGNRSVSSRCGSADVLEQLGATLTPDPAVSRHALDEAGVCFLFAPLYHPGARHAAPVRKKIGTRTIFNVLGPLVNPARPSIQVMGVYAPRLVPIAAQTLVHMGCGSAMTVHGSGLDELALHGPTSAVRVHQRELTPLEITPEQLGLTGAPIEALAGGGPEQNAAWLRDMLAGRGNDVHNRAVAANAAVVLWLAGKVDTLRDGTKVALEQLHSGEPARRLEAFVELSRG